jgi:prolipoprotein diacylglyceryltransferase
MNHDSIKWYAMFILIMFTIATLFFTFKTFKNKDDKNYFVVIMLGLAIIIFSKVLNCIR